MVDAWWAVAAAAAATIPILLPERLSETEVPTSKGLKKALKEENAKERITRAIFSCAREFALEKEYMLKKVGAFSKDPIKDTCVTVCGVSELDACADACARTMCVDQHQVPNWIDICLRRCWSECLKLKLSESRLSS